MIAMLLPILGAATVASGDRTHVEQVLSETVHDRVQAGWSIVDVHDERDARVLVATRGEAVERHVLHLDGVTRYVIERDAQLPIELEEPNPELLRALAAPRGGFRLHEGCGEFYEQPYEIEDAATDELATGLVTRTLVTAADVLYAEVEGHRARFVLERDGNQHELHATLDARGAIVAAELRRTYLSTDRETSYKRLGSLRSALRGGRVSSIQGGGGVTLQLRVRDVTVRPAVRAFALDPTGVAFAYYGDDEGCGC